MKKEFALAQIRPYALNPELCGWNGHSCEYMTKDGKLDVVGRNMIDPSKAGNYAVIDLLTDIPEDKVFRASACGMLSKEEWQYLQEIHDAIAKKDDKSIWHNVKHLGLFSYEELYSPITEYA